MGYTLNWLKAKTFTPSTNEAVNEALEYAPDLMIVDTLRRDEIWGGSIPNIGFGGAVRVHRITAKRRAHEKNVSVAAI